MKNSILILLLLAFAPLVAISQPLITSDIQLPEAENLITSALAPDSSIIAIYGKLGASESGLIVKIDARGSVKWIRKCQSSSKGFRFTTIAITPSGLIVVSGYEYQTDTDGKPISLALSSDGILQWAYRYSLWGGCMGSCATNTGMIVLNGPIFSKNPSHPSEIDEFTYVMTISSDGIPQWGNRFSSQYDFLQTIHCAPPIVCKDSTIMVTGGIKVATSAFDLFLIHLTPAGFIKALRTYPAKGLSVEGSKLLQTTGGSIVLWATSSNDIVSVPIVLCLDAGLRIRWSNFCASFTDQECSSLFQEENGEVVSFLLSHGIEDVLTHNVVRFDTTGRLLAAADFTNHLQLNGQLQPLKATADRYCLLSHNIRNTFSYPDISIISSSFTGCFMEPTLGTISSIELFDTTFRYSYSALSVSEDTVAMQVTSVPIIMDEICTTPSNEVRTVSASIPLSIYPNPSHSAQPVTISVAAASSGRYELSIQSISGSEVYRTSIDLQDKQTQLQLPTQNLASGIYIAELIDANTHAVVGREKFTVIGSGE